MKVKGDLSFEYFKKEGYETFRKTMLEHFPDSEFLMPNMKDFFDNSKLTHMLTSKCAPWRFGKF